MFDYSCLLAYSCICLFHGLEKYGMKQIEETSCFWICTCQKGLWLEGGTYISSKRGITISFLISFLASFVSFEFLTDNGLEQWHCWKIGPPLPTTVVNKIGRYSYTYHSDMVFAVHTVQKMKESYKRMLKVELITNLKQAY